MQDSDYAYYEEHAGQSTYEDTLSGQARFIANNSYLGVDLATVTTGYRLHVLPSKLTPLNIPKNTRSAVSPAMGSSSLLTSGKAHIEVRLHG